MLCARHGFDSLSYEHTAEIAFAKSKYGYVYQGHRLLPAELGKFPQKRAKVKHQLLHLKCSLVSITFFSLKTINVINIETTKMADRY